MRPFKFISILVICITILSTNNVVGLPNDRIPIKDYWIDNGSLDYSVDYLFDFNVDDHDAETSYTGSIELEGKTADNSSYNFVDTTVTPTYDRMDNYGLYTLNPADFNEKVINLVKDEQLVLSFTAEGGLVDFLIMDKENFNNLLNGDPIEVSDYLPAEKTFSGVITASETRAYYFCKNFFTE